MKKEGFAYFSLALAMILVGGSVVAGKLMVAAFPVFLASGIRFGLALVVLLPLLLWRQSCSLKLPRREWWILFWQASTGVFLFTVLLLAGLKFTNATEAGIIISTTPVAVMVLSYFLLRERFSRLKGTAVCLTVGGLLILNLSTPAAVGAHTGSLLGNLLILGAVVGEALFTILRKLSADIVSPLFTAVAMSGFGFILFLPVAVWQALHFDFSGIEAVDWLTIVYYAVGVTVIAYLLWFYGVTRVAATTAALFTGLMPLTAVVLSYLLLKEPFSWAHAAGGVCILLSLGTAIFERNTSPALLKCRGRM